MVVTCGMSMGSCPKRASQDPGSRTGSRLPGIRTPGDHKNGVVAVRTVQAEGGNDKGGSGDHPVGSGGCVKP